MTVAVALEHRFVVAADGSAWTADAYARPFWEAYRDVFGEVVVVARARSVARCPDRMHHRVSGDGVRFHAVPYFVGPTAYLRHRSAVRRAVSNAVRDASAVVVRVPGTLGGIAAEAARSMGRPLMAEVVADPADVFAPGASAHPARTFLRAHFVRQLRELCEQAAVVAYVTERALQVRYPPGPCVWSTNYSDVQLGPEAYRVAIPPPRVAGPYTLVTVASLDQPYKAVDVQIEALRLVRARGLDTVLRVVGDGRMRVQLEALARACGLTDAVTFVGRLPGADAVRAELDGADLFLLPSRTEGLPRALIEAMARGIACLGSHAGGIPELLPDDDRVAAGDALALSNLVEEVLRDPARRLAMARRNVGRARSFESGLLASRRAEAYARLRAAAEADVSGHRG